MHRDAENIFANESNLRPCGSIHRRPQQVTVASLCHPTCTRQMAIMYNARALGFTRGVKTKDDPYGFMPIGTFLSGI